MSPMPVLPLLVVLFLALFLLDFELLNFLSMNLGCEHENVSDLMIHLNLDFTYLSFSQKIQKVETHS